MRVEVKSSEVMEKRGTAARTGKPYVIREQKGWMETGKAYPSEVTIPLQDDQPPFSPGHYVLGPQCFWVGRFGVVNVDLSKMQRDSAASAVRPNLPPSKQAEARIAG